MQELIPLTEFDKRRYPDVSEEDKINFILHSNDFERISMKFDEIQAQLLIPQKASPAVQGQMRSLNILFELASDPELVPEAKLISDRSFDKLFPWFKRFHKNLMHDFFKKGELLVNHYDYPSEDELGQYRTIEKILGHRKMPEPENITRLLAEAFQNFAKTYNKYKDAFSNPRVLELQDWQKLEKDIHKLALSICCIKPFKDGSNRVARLTENLLRLNIGLKFKIYSDKDKYLNDIQALQDSDYRAV